MAVEIVAARVSLDESKRCSRQGYARACMADSVAVDLVPYMYHVSLESEPHCTKQEMLEVLTLVKRTIVVEKTVRV